MEKKEYVTKTRTLLIEFLKSHKSQRLSAQEICQGLTSDDSCINITTVYRTLEKLWEEKKLLKSKGPNEKSFVYQFIDPADASSCHSHLHLQCTRCGKVFHLNHEAMDALENRLLADYGFSVDCDDSVMQGLCKECKSIESEK